MARQYSEGSISFGRPEENCRNRVQKSMSYCHCYYENPQAGKAEDSKKIGCRGNDKYGYKVYVDSGSEACENSCKDPERCRKKQFKEHYPITLTLLPITSRLPSYSSTFPIISSCVPSAMERFLALFLNSTTFTTEGFSISIITILSPS